MEVIGSGHEGIFGGAGRDLYLYLSGNFIRIIHIVNIYCAIYL